MKKRLAVNIFCTVLVLAALSSCIVSPILYIKKTRDPTKLKTTTLKPTTTDVNAQPLQTTGYISSTTEEPLLQESSASSILSETSEAPATPVETTDSPLVITSSQISTNPSTIADLESLPPESEQSTFPSTTIVFESTNFLQTTRAFPPTDSFTEGSTTEVADTTAASFSNPCFDYDCEGGICFTVGDEAQCIDGVDTKIGFLTYDRNMTVKCANGNNKFPMTKHECHGGKNFTPCGLDQVKIHMTFFEATENANEYYINTHYDDKLGTGPERAMYLKDENDHNAGFVHQLVIDDAITDYSKVGSTWIMEKVKCSEEPCPFFVRAGEQPEKGWKRWVDPDKEDPLAGSSIVFETIEENNEDFLWFIEAQKVPK